ncbi:hypothetical protein [Jeotgalibaca porci]|uniref:hypothetical protein n=1 Tax=Jeotgalibaca porci TaxID=1868793 RepID=UPI0035A1BA75
MLKGLDMLKQLESLTPNTKYYFMYKALETQFSLFFFHEEYEELTDKNKPYSKFILSYGTTEEYLEKANAEELKAYEAYMNLDLDRFAEIEKQVFEEWLVSSRFVETVLKATKGHEPSIDEVRRVSGRFNRAGINMGNRSRNKKENINLESTDIPKDLEIMYQEIRKKIEAKGEIKL